MIIPLPFIVSLLFTITYAQNFEYKIDPSRCNEDTACFVKRGCYVVPDEDTDLDTTLVDFDDPVEKLKDGTCNIFVQMKAISKKKILVLMEVKGIDATEIKIEQGVSADSTPTPVNQLGCKKDDPEPKGNDNFQKSYQQPPIFKSDVVFCSFIISSSTEPIEAIFSTDTSKPSFVISAATQLSLTYDLVGAALKCFGEITSLDTSTESYTLKRADISKFPINCGNKNLLVKHKSVEYEVKELTCKSRKLVWEGGSAEVDLLEDIEISCIYEKFCALCEQAPAPDNCPESKCKPPKGETDTKGCKTLKCEDEGSQWTFDGTSYSPASDPLVCKKSGTGPAKSGWFFTPTDGDAVEHAKFGCISEKDCPPTFTFKCPDSFDCKSDNDPQSDGTTYTCKEGLLQKDNGTLVTSLACDKSTGKWNNLEGTETLFCAPEKKVDAEAKEAPSTGSTTLVVALVIGGLVVVGGIAGAAYYFLVHKKRNAARKTTKKEEGTSKKSSKKSGGVGSSDEGTAKKDKETKKESASDPNKESEKPANGAEPPKDGKEPPKDGKEAPKDATAPGAPSPAPAGSAPATPAAAGGPLPPAQPPTPISNLKTDSLPDAPPAAPSTPATPVPPDATPV